MNKKVIIKYVGNFGIVLAVAGAIAYALGFIELNLFETILGLGGFAGLAGLRTEIESSGYKTWIISIAGALIMLGFANGVIKPDIATVLLTVLGVATKFTLAHAISKVR